MREECPDLDIAPEPPIVFVPYKSFSKRPYEDVRRRVPNPERARQILGFEAKVALEEGLRQTIRWHRQALSDARARGEV
jgi:nucleoside-diphosphate-sugar epimerase